MAEAQTSPRPWRACGGYTPAYASIASADGRYIVWAMADVNVHREGSGARILAPDYETQRANAHLIVAAVNAWNDPAALRARAEEIEKAKE